MKRSPYILLLLSAFFLCCISFKGQAQIIPDSDIKLRTIRVKKKGREIFNWNKNQQRPLEGDGAYVLGKRLKHGKFTSHEFEKNKIRSVMGHKNHFNASDLSRVTNILRKSLKFVEFEKNDFEKSRIRSVSGQKNYFNASVLSWSTFDLFIKSKPWNSFRGPTITDVSIKKSDQGGYLNSKNRDWNLLWVNLGPSTRTPEGIKEKVSPAKFDKKERKIWNN